MYYKMAQYNKIKEGTALHFALLTCHIQLLKFRKNMQTFTLKPMHEIIFLVSGSRSQFLVKFGPMVE